MALKHEYKIFIAVLAVLLAVVSLFLIGTLNFPYDQLKYIYLVFLLAFLLIIFSFMGLE